MSAKGTLLGIGWLAGITAICAVMLACMLGHIVWNKMTAGRWWL
jgi:hypothetical protein